MREFKFRAWAGGVMVYFDLFNIKPINGLDDAKHIQRVKAPHLSVSDKCHIMQYTGLNDKNGWEIYDGDILLTDTGNKGVVRHSNSVCWHIQYNLRDNPNVRKDIPYDTSNKIMSLWDKEGRIEVIGNIYENSELIKQED
jgi:uncharacterized phage protein (TIGR01671 family)